jgi:hypothetical protein
VTGRPALPPPERERSVTTDCLCGGRVARLRRTAGRADRGRDAADLPGRTRALKDLGLSHVSARPKAYKQDPEAMEAFKKTFPHGRRKSARSSHRAHR